MGLGARQDALDDQWSFWNWRIIVSLGYFIIYVSATGWELSQTTTKPRGHGISKKEGGMR